MPFGNINKAGSNAGSVVQVSVIAAFGPIPTNQEGEITDWTGSCAGVAVDSTLILQMSNDNFVGNVVEKARMEFPSANTYTLTYGGETGKSRLVVPEGYKIRVVGVQGTADVMASSICGQTRRMDPTHGGRDSDGPGDSFMDL